MTSVKESQEDQEVLSKWIVKKGNNQVWTIFHKHGFVAVGDLVHYILKHNKEVKA